MTTYTPNISEAGVYYIVCKSTWSNGFMYSNEVQVNVAGNNVSPINDQTITPSTNGSTLNVNEYPSATSREWKYKTSPGGSWNSFSTAQTSANYTPNFASTGTYYIACFSVIGGSSYTSNEVMVTVADNSISPATQQTIPVNTDGTQLFVSETVPSDSRGWYYSITSGSDYDSYLGNDATYTPNFTEVGEYFIVCKSNWGSASKLSNEVKVAVAGNNIAPTTEQTIAVNSDGSTITVTEYPTATSREWKYKTSPSGSWTSFNAVETTESYTPNFVISGIYYVACFSEIGSSTFVSNEVRINVASNSIAPIDEQILSADTDGTQLTLTESIAADSRGWYFSTISGSSYDNYLEDGLTYTPNFSVVGEYFIVCKSTWGTTVAISNEVRIVIAGNDITPETEQTIAINNDGLTLTVTEYPTATSRDWKYKTSPSGTWTSFGTAETSETYTPNFTSSGTYYIACFSEIAGNTYTSIEVTINVVSNSIAPIADQIIPANTDGTELIVTESMGADSRAWYYSITSGDNYDNYIGDGLTYTPNFSGGGEYFVVCKSTWGTTAVTSNEVRIAIAGNNITPVENQTIAMNTDGVTVTVTEYPTATSREWKYKTSPSGTWTSFGIAETSETYTPNFATSGTYFIVCFSEIGGSTYTSIEVKVIVVSNSIAPIADQIIPANTDGTELAVTESIEADSRAWYYSTTSGDNYDNYIGDGLTYTPNFSGGGEYFVVCKSTWGTTAVTSNEVRIAIAGNNITPVENQTIAMNTDGVTVTVTEYPTATSREWKYKTSPSGTWTSFGIAETSETYTPNFATSGTYFIACFSEIGGSTYTSIEVKVIVVSNSIAPIADQIIPANTDGTELAVTESIEADSRAWYYSTLSGVNYDNYIGDGMTYTPNFSGGGEYFIVCKSTWGTSTAISNEVRVAIAGNNIAPVDNQTINVESNGTTLTVSEYPTATSREWKYKTSEGGAWTSFSVAETSKSYVPIFTTAGTYYIACFSEIGGNTYESNMVLITVNVSSSINSLEHYGIKMFPNPSNGYFTIQQNDILESISVYTIDGKLIYLNANISTKSTLITVPTKGIHSVVMRTKKGKSLVEKIIIY